MRFLTMLWRAPAGAFLLVLLGALLFWGPEHHRRDLWNPDEARIAYVARQMREDGNWLVLHRHDTFYAHKPPLMYWAVNLGATLFTGGEINRVATRLPSLLGAAAALWALVLLMRHFQGREAADVEAALLAATTFLFWKQGGWGQIDMLLCGLQMLALLALFSQDRRPSWPRALAAYIAMGLAVLAKGPVGLIVPLGAYLSAKLAAGERADLRRSHWLWGPLVALLIPGVWLLAVWLQHPPEGYLRELLFKQNIDRAQGELGHLRPLHYYLQYLLMDGLPWVLFLPFAWRSLGATPEDRLLRRRLAGWAGFVVVFFSLIASKRNLYILLAYPALAMLIATACRRACAHRIALRIGTALEQIPWIAVSIALVISIASPWIPDLAPYRLQTTTFGLLATLLLLLAWKGWRKTLADAPPARPASVAVAWALLLSAVGGFLLPALNEHKTPRELVPIVEQHLAKGQPLFLYKMNLEILCLYTHTRGRVFRDEPSLIEAMSLWPNGLLVCQEETWDTLAPALAETLEPLFFTMGGKTLVAARWDHRDDASH